MTKYLILEVFLLYLKRVLLDVILDHQFEVWHALAKFWLILFLEQLVCELLLAVSLQFEQLIWLLIGIVSKERTVAFSNIRFQAGN